MTSTRLGGAPRVALAVLTALAIGLVGLWGVITDIGPGDSLLKRLLMTGLVYAIGSAAVGALVPRRWYVSLLGAWGPFAFGLVGLFVKLANGGLMRNWRILALTLLAAPAMAMLFGYLGAWARVKTTSVVRSAS